MSGDGSTSNASISEYDKAEDVEPPAKDSSEHPQGTDLAFKVVALALSIFLASLDMTSVATAIPKITDEFHGLDKVSWYGSAFFMTNGGFQSSLICGVAPSSTALIVGRAIAGLGVAGIGTGAYTIIAFVAEPKKRPMFTGIIGMSYGIASVVGPLIGGVFSDKVSWRWCFYFNLPIGGVSALIILLFFQSPRGAKPVTASWKEKLLQMDLVGTVIIMGAVVAYILALQYGGQTKSWDSSVVIGLIVGLVVILIAFGVWEYYQGERAMVVPRLFKHRKVGFSCIYSFFFAGSYFLVIYYLPIYFQSINNFSPTMSGVDNLSSYLIRHVSGAAIAMIASGLLYTLDIDTSSGKWIGYQILGGVGWGIAFQVPIIVGQGNAKPKDISSVTAMVLFFQNVGGTTFVSAAQSAFVNKLITTLSITAPGVDPAAVVATGATQIRAAFTVDQIPGILAAYMAGIKFALALSIGATGVAFLVSLFSNWTRLNTEALKGASGDV
ncbi:hypothetical protein MMC31_000205 [Peltigera leucophlebia]|nr:hypothetical protein [Peltigera leucophlebia]